MHWGNWLFNAQYLTLTHAVESYEIDLKRIRSSAAILDWIFQILRKPWADSETMHDLLHAFQDMLHPQANFCPWEEDRRADGGRLARTYAGGLWEYFNPLKTR